MAKGILKVDGILPRKITVVETDGTTHTLKKLSDADGRVLWEDIDYKYVMLVRSNWGGQNLYGLEWELIEQTTDGYKVGSDGTSIGNFLRADIIEVLSFPNDLDGRTDLTDLFSFCQYLRYIDVSMWDMSHVTNITRIFHRMGACVLEAGEWDTSNIEHMDSAFDNFGGELKGFERWNTSNLVTMTNCFFGAPLRSINLSNWYAPKLTNMSIAFQNSAANIIKLPTTDENRTINIARAFNITPVEEIDFTCWHNVQIVGGSYFASCSNLNNIIWGDLLNYNFQITDSLFYLNKIDLFPHFPGLSMHQDVWDAFNGCTNITTLDLSCANVGSLARAQRFLMNCSNLKTFYINGWGDFRKDKEIDLTDFFSGCINLTDIYAYGCSLDIIDKFNAVKPLGAKLHTSFPAVMDGLTTRFDGHAQWYGAVKAGKQNNSLDSSYGTMVGSLPQTGIARPEGSFHTTTSNEFRPDTQDWTIEWVVQPKCYQFWNTNNLSMVTSSSDERSKRLLTLDLEDTESWNRGYPIVRIDGVLGGREFPAVGEALDLDTDRIYRISITYNEGNWSLYVDGELHASYMYAVDFSKDTNRIYMTGFPPYAHCGSFARYSVNIYNRALSAQEIKQNYDKSYEDYGEYNYNITLPFEIL